MEVQSYTPEAHGTALFAYKELAPHAWRRVVADALRTQSTVPRAAKVLGVAPATLRSWRRDDPDLKAIKVQGRGRPEMAAGVSREDIREVIHKCGGLDQASSLTAVPPARLDRYAARGKIPLSVWRTLRDCAND
jgi:hypothetical protein